MNTQITVACPHCQKKMTWDSSSPFRPFCSEQCKLIDFGAWVNERHVIMGDSQTLVDGNLPDDHSDE